MKEKILKIFGSVVIILTILSCAKNDIDCEYIQKVCNDPDAQGVADCAVIIECKSY